MALMAQESATNWRLWCRLCAKDDPQGNINVFLKHEQAASDASPAAATTSTAASAIGDLALATAIGKYFWVNITRGEELPEMICTECLTLVTSLVNFSERITRVQKLYCILQSTAKQDDLQELRNRFGLLDEEERSPVLLPPRQTLTEVHYVDEKPKLNDEGLLEEALELENPLTPANQSDQEEEEEDADVDGDDEALMELCEAYAAATPSEEDSDGSDAYSSVSQKLSERKKRLEQSQRKDFPCGECSRVYRSATTLRRHVRQEHNATPEPTDQLSCLECEKQFPTASKLTRHMRQHLPMAKRKIYPCNSCDKKFTSSNSAQHHSQYMHLDERHQPFICEQCGAARNSNAALKEHMLTHTDYAPFECDVCQKCFKSARRLKHHKDTHDPHKYICPECGTQLNSRITLNRHRLVHTDKMQYKCDYCGREFKRAKALKNHLILHTGLKPYCCDFCDRTFANGSNCRTHKKKSHPEELAAQEAAGGGKANNLNIPKLAALRAFTKNKDNLSPVSTKQSGCFAFGKKPKPVKTAPVSAAAAPTTAGIPTIDNIYNHIMKQSPTTPPPPVGAAKEQLSDNVSLTLPPSTQLLLTRGGNAALVQPAAPTGSLSEPATPQVFPF